MLATVVVIMARGSHEKTAGPLIVDEGGKPGGFATGLGAKEAGGGDLRQHSVVIGVPFAEIVAIAPSRRAFPMPGEEFWFVSNRKPEQTAAADASYIGSFTGIHGRLIDQEVESPDYMPMNAPGKGKERSDQGFGYDRMCQACCSCIGRPDAFIGRMAANMQGT